MTYLRPNIERMEGYVSGEQPQIPGLIKLNTNENPYPPSPKVLRALRGAINQKLRFYPDPDATMLREKIARLYKFAPEQVILGNGCDDILNLSVRAFCSERQELIYLQPSYSLYPVLADIQGAVKTELLLDEQFEIPSEPFAQGKLSKPLAWARVIFITNPNAPSGILIPHGSLQKIIEKASGVVVLDEAYMDFADEGNDGLDLARRYPNVLVARSFSKSFALAGMRIGFAVGHPALVAGLRKIKDSYNVNRLSQVAALAALEDLPYIRRMIGKIRATRVRLKTALEKLGFFVYPSQANFLFVRPPAPLTAQRFYETLREEKVLIRWFNAPRVRDCARISVGTDDETKKLINITKRIISSRRAGSLD